MELRNRRSNSLGLDRFSRPEPGMSMRSSWPATRTPSDSERCKTASRRRTKTSLRFRGRLGQYADHGLPPAAHPSSGYLGLQGTRAKSRSGASGSGGRSACRIDVGRAGSEWSTP